MRAIVIPEFGPPEVLRPASLPNPVPSANEIVVRVRASGVNRADLLQRRGLYPPPPGVTDVPGLEFAGVVEELGRGAGRWRVGDRVMGIVAGGGYAERVTVDAGVALPIPAAMAMATAGAIPEIYITAWDAVFRQVGLRAGETLLIHAVGSGVGTAALQLARRVGARTIGTSRTPWKLERALEMGLDAALAGEGDWDAAVREATGGRGADVILDLVGGPYLARNQAAIANRGRHVVVGVPGGVREQIDLRRLMASRARIFGTVLRARSVGEKRDLARAFEASVLAGFVDGALEPAIDCTFPASRGADAHRRMEANENFGKIVLTWQDGGGGSRRAGRTRERIREAPDRR